MFITNVKEGDTMADVKRGNGMEDFLLKECYELAAQYEKVEAVRDILSENGDADYFGSNGQTCCGGSCWRQSYRNGGFI